VNRLRRTYAAGAALAALLLAGQVGCDDDPEPDAGGPSSSASSSGSSSASSATSEPTVTASSGSAAPSVAPASGIQLAEASSTITAPAGWELQPEILEYASAAAKPGGLSSVQLVDSGDISGGASLDSLAQSTLDTLPPGAQGERLPDVELDGQAFLHVHYTVKGEPLEHDTYTTVRNERNIGLDFVLLKRDTATNPALIESVLATFRWTA
jgi:hypothetical protein